MFPLLSSNPCVQKDLTAYPTIFDVNLNYQGAVNRLTYLADGHYLDNETRSVDVQFITFNGNKKKPIDTSTSTSPKG